LGEAREKEVAEHVDKAGKGNRPHGNNVCPVHGAHKWKEYFLNPHGDNYRPQNDNGNGSKRSDSFIQTLMNQP